MAEYTAAKTRQENQRQVIEKLVLNSVASLYAHCLPGIQYRRCTCSLGDSAPAASNISVSAPMFTSRLCSSDMASEMDMPSTVAFSDEGAEVEANS